MESKENSKKSSEAKNKLEKFIVLPCLMDIDLLNLELVMRTTGHIFSIQQVFLKIIN